MKLLLLTVGNIYIDHNVFGVKGGVEFRLESGKDYFGVSGEHVLGGSAVNAAMQAARLGVEVGFIGKTGADAGAQEVRALLEAKGILPELMCQDASHATSMAVNLIDNKGEFIGVHYGEASKTLAASDIKLDHALFDRSQAVYFGGTAKQPLLFPDCEAMFRALHRRGIKIFYDPNRFPAQEALTDRSLLHAQLAYVEGYFPNEEELLQMAGSTSTDEALDYALSSGVQFVALKRGAKGCRVKTRDADFVVKGHSVKAVSTVGAGDCFNATFIANYLKGVSLRRCAELATAAAAIKVGQNTWPDEAEIQAMVG
jgi:sugar/nucleoside kinase (ribokinase family)